MKKNIGVLDKIGRLSLVLIICALYLVDALGGTFGIVMGVIAFYLTITSFIGFCIVYVPFHYSTIERIKAGKTRKS